MCRLSERVYRKRFSFVLPVIMSALMAACASGGAGRHSELSAVDGGAETSDGPTHVVVSNQSWQRVTVYITQGSMLWRLGDVEARSDRTLPLKNFGRSLMGSTSYFVARPLAGTPFRSEGFEMSPRGGVPIWTIENHTATSFVTIR
jgi:hypothetical protein